MAVIAARDEDAKKAVGCSARHDERGDCDPEWRDEREAEVNTADQRGFGLNSSHFRVGAGGHGPIIGARGVLTNPKYHVG
jgi:hypothetical protein